MVHDYYVINHLFLDCFVLYYFYIINIKTYLE
jgi:hypothetical protein